MAAATHHTPRAGAQKPHAAEQHQGHAIPMESEEAMMRRLNPQLMAEQAKHMAEQQERHKKLAEALKLYKNAEFLWNESDLGEADLRERPENKTGAKITEGKLRKAKKGVFAVMSAPFYLLGLIPGLGIPFKTIAEKIYVTKKTAEHHGDHSLANEYIVSPKAKPIAESIKKLPPGVYEARKAFVNYTIKHNITPQELDKFSQLVDRIRRPQIRYYFEQGKPAAAKAGHH